MMKQKALTELTDEELLEKAKAIQNSKITSAVFLGMMIGIAVYSTFKNGFGFFTFFPLFFLPMAKANNIAIKAVAKEMQARNLTNKL